MFEEFSKSISIVLVQPKRPSNIGSAARAMHCMGLTDLVLVQPRCQIDRTAFNLAVGSSEILINARIFDSLDELLPSYSLVAGTTKRTGKKRRNFVEMRRFCQEILPQHPAARTAILFGPEDYGLAREHLQKCQYLISIPVSREFGSLNLAQSVMIACYELKASLQDVSPAKDDGKADSFQMELLSGAVEDALSRSGYPVKKGSRHVAGKLKEILSRAHLTEPEVHMLLGLARHACYLGDRLFRNREEGKEHTDEQGG